MEYQNFFLSLVAIIAAVNAFDPSEQGLTTLTFVFDTTGSMSDDLRQAIDMSVDITQTIVADKNNAIHNYVMVPYNDPGVGPVTETLDSNVFLSRLKGLTVSGGGDCPEMALGGLKLALDAALPQSTIYVFTDASAKDHYKVDEILKLLLKKKMKIVFLMTGDCGDLNQPSYLVYEQIATTSSGQVFHLQKHNVHQVLEIIKDELKSGKVNLAAGDYSAAGNENIDLIVDPSLNEFSVSLSGNAPRIILTDPSGNEVKEGTGGAEVILNLPKIKVVKVKKPATGVWRVQVVSSSAYTLRITGFGNFDFVHGFSRIPASTLKETYHRPLQGVETYLLLNGTDFEGGDMETVKLLSLEGKVERESPVKNLRENLYNATSPFLPPSGLFYIQILGKDAKGNYFQRISPTAISSQLPDKPEVTVVPSKLEVHEFEKVTFTCQVQSLVPFDATWYKGTDGAHPLRDYKFEQSHEITYTIDKVRIGDEGLFSCNATNVAGKDEAKLELIVKEPLVPPVPDCVSDGQLLADPLDCSSFYQCDYGVPHKSKCSGGLHFNPELGVCDWPQNVNCS